MSNQLALRHGAALLLLGTLSVAGVERASAILERAGEHVHDAGAFRLFVTNLGFVGNPTYPSFSDHPSLEWPAGSGNEYLLDAGLWVGARDRLGSVIGVTTATPVNEFRPSLAPIDRIYEVHEGARGSRRLGTTSTREAADDDGDGRIDEEFPNGKDDDGDGQIDEDYFAVGAQAFGCEMRDDTEEARSQLIGHRPLGIQVRQLSFTWEEGTAGLDRCAVVRYEVQNRSGEALYDVLLGFYVDPDVGPKAHAGYWRDDRYAVESVRGSFPARGGPIVFGCPDRVPFALTVVTVEDVPDGTDGANGGDAPGILGAVLLDHTTNRWGYRAPEQVGPRAIVHLAGRVSASSLREDVPDADKYRLMAGSGFSGNAEVADHRFLMVAGPYAVVPAGASLELTVALVLAPDREEMAATLGVLADRFHGLWLDLDRNRWTGTHQYRGPVGKRFIWSGEETCLRGDESPFCYFMPFAVDHDCDEEQTMRLGHAGCLSAYSQDVCPHLLSRAWFAPDSCYGSWTEGQPCACSDRVPVRSRERCVYVDWDCDPCTPNIDGAESLAHWAEVGAEPPRQRVEVRLTPGDREVLVEWDNASELPPADRSLPRVAGYRVWRAGGWTRAPGSSGPRDADWELAAELALPGTGLPAPPETFIREGMPVVEQVPGPGDSLYPHYAVGRYGHIDRGVANGFALFYDVTPFGIAHESGGGLAFDGLLPRGTSGEEVYAVDAPAEDGAIDVVPNPYVAHAPWDLAPNRLDPSGRKIVFRGLPPRPGRITIFSLAGDRVVALEHDGRAGAADWDLMSRNGQPVAAGIYLWVFDDRLARRRGKLVIVK